MKTITSNTEAEIVEKRSKFIGNLYYVETEEQAENKLKEIKKKYNDARHNCFAYRVYDKNTVIERASDDGEPSGTAGAPMLNLLSKSDLVNCIIIVTRYFGGILLGTGGLVRAYTESAKQTLNKVQIIEIEPGKEVQVQLPYDKLGEFQHYCQKNNISIQNVEYNQNIVCKIHINNENIEKALNDTIKRQYNLQNVKILNDIYLKTKNM